MRRILLPTVLIALALGLSTIVVGHLAAQGGGSAGAVAIKGLAGCANDSLPANDDGSTAAVALPFSLNFFGTTYTSLYVNNNGNVTFDSPLPTYTPFGLLATTHVIIAPYFADVDTRGTGSGLTTYGSTSYAGRPAFCVDWLNVGYYQEHTEKLNSFQLLLIDRSDIGVGDFDIMMNYSQVQWETGDASGGTGGLGGHSSRMGYSNGSSASFELPGSGVNGALLDSAASGLTHNSRGSFVPGRYIFEVRNGVAPTGGSISGHVYGPLILAGEGGPGGSSPLVGALVQICRVGGGCGLTTSNAEGAYSLSGLADGQYVGSAFSPPGSDLFPGTAGPVQLIKSAALQNVDFHLTRPSAPPQGFRISSLYTTPSGAPVISWSQSIPFSITNCPGGSSAAFQVLMGATVLTSGSLTEASPGVYNGKIVPLSPAHGPAKLHITINCPPPTPNKNINIDIYIDPSGTVKTVGGDPIPSATVTLYRSDSSGGPFDVVPNGSAVMSVSNRNNPDMTDTSGVFHWDVIAGYYKVRAQKQGCHAPGNADVLFVETGVLSIPPPAVGIDLRLDCGGGGSTATPTPTATRTPTATPPPAALRGDANCDHTVNAIDAALDLQYGAGLLQTLGCLSNADANHDGMVNSIDAALILQYVAGLLQHL